LPEGGDFGVIGCLLGRRDVSLAQIGVSWDGEQAFFLLANRHILGTCGPSAVHPSKAIQLSHGVGYKRQCPDFPWLYFWIYSNIHTIDSIMSQHEKKSFNYKSSKHLRSIQSTQKSSYSPSPYS
jgi:hypothetical protein